MQRRKLLVVLAGLAVVVAAGAFVLWPRPDRITRENYERIRVGMSSAEVEAILGGPPGDYRTVRTEDEMYPRCFDLDAMAWHVECDRDFEAYREPMWFGNQGIIRVSFKSGFVAELPAGLERAGETLPCKHFDGTVPCMASTLETLLWRAKRQWHRWFPE